MIELGVDSGSFASLHYSGRGLGFIFGCLLLDVKTYLDMILVVLRVNYQNLVVLQVGVWRFGA